MGKLLGLFKKNGKKERNVVILSIDGGGIRGIVPAYIIKKIAEKLEEEGDERPFYSHFDLIAGTSTGALLALGLASNGKETILKRDEGKSIRVEEDVRTGLFKRETVFKGYIPRGLDAKELEKIYLENAPLIFPRKLSSSMLLQLVKDKYDEKGLEDFLKKCLQDEKLGDANVPVVLISYDTDGSKPYLFSSYGTPNVLMRHGARASSAAPMYFHPFAFVDGNGERKVLLDGGLVANNPSFIAYTEAKKLYPEGTSFTVISLSTAKPSFSFDPSGNPGGLTGWASPIIKVYMSSQENMTDFVMENTGDVEYIRISGGGTGGKRIHLDDTSKESLGELERIAKDVYRENEGKIERIISILKDKPTGNGIKLSKGVDEGERALVQVLDVPPEPS